MAQKQDENKERESKISFGTISGIVLGCGLFVFSVVSSTDNYFMFLNAASFFLVFGGTLAATMISYHGRYVMRAFRDLSKILIPSNISPKSLYVDVETIIWWSKIATVKGPFVLERAVKIAKNKDPLLYHGMQLLVTGYDPAKLREMLDSEVETTFERNLIQADILRAMASIAPAFGMIGTLVGLIVMLDNMAGDPTRLGKGLAIALLTTLYGVMLAQLIFRPAARKLQQKEEMLRFRNYLIVEGLVLLAEQKSPMVIQDTLNCFLDPKLRFSLVSKKKRPAVTSEQGK